MEQLSLQLTNKYKPVLDYIDSYWEKITFFHPEDEKIHIGLPHHFLAPNETYFGKDEFYWDSFFMSMGLLTNPSKQNIHIVKGILANFAFLQNKFGVIPLRNKFYNLGISQPPFISTLVLEVFSHTKDKMWLEEMAYVIETELETYWKDEHHITKTGLSRYCDHHVNHTTAEHESGWDMTSRFSDRCLDYNPIDLNSCLYKYEVDLITIYTTLEKFEKIQEYEEKANLRKKLMHTYCWNDEFGFYFDYNHVKESQSPFQSLAGFFPLWAGLTDEHNAKRVEEKISLFEYAGGLSTSQTNDLSEEYKQWDHPNGWPNLQYIVVEGLYAYGFFDTVNRIGTKWLDMVDKVFFETNVLWEKYNVVTCDRGKDGRYPTQTGFGWANASVLLILRRIEQVI